MSSISELIETIREKSKERDETLKKLERSLALKKLWGSDPIEWPIRSGIYGSQTKGYYFYIKDNAGVEKKYDLKEIPACVRKAKHIDDALKHISRFRRV